MRPANDRTSSLRDGIQAMLCSPLILHPHALCAHTLQLGHYPIWEMLHLEAVIQSGSHKKAVVTKFDACKS